MTHNRNTDVNANAYGEEKTITIAVHRQQHGRRRRPEDDFKNIKCGILKFAVVKTEHSLCRKGCIRIQSDRWIIVII